MAHVVTEICDETGSWLEDFVVEEFPGSIQLKQPITTNVEATEYKEFLSRFPIRTENVIIRRQSRIEEAVSYKIHTNRELSMMLLGIKPLSVFSKFIFEDYDVYNDQKFTLFSNKIGTKSVTINDKEYLFKFLDGEEWRWKAFHELTLVRLSLGNCAKLEMMEGSLLGYSGKQNLEFLEKFYRKQVF